MSSPLSSSGSGSCCARLSTAPACTKYQVGPNDLARSGRRQCSTARISPLRGSVMSDWLSFVRRHPVNDRVPRVFGAPFRIVLRRLARLDRVPESRGFERRLPRLDAALHVAAPTSPASLDRCRRRWASRARRRPRSASFFSSRKRLMMRLLTERCSSVPKSTKFMRVEADALVEVAAASSPSRGSFIRLWCTSTVPLGPRMPGAGRRRARRRHHRRRHPPRRR